MITTIIFDMNGVIVDDEKLHKQAFKKICKKYDIDLSSKEYQNLCMGRTDEEGFMGIARKYKLDNVDKNNLVRQKAERYLELIPNNLKEFPGVIELIKNLSNTFTLALTSSSLA